MRGAVDAENLLCRVQSLETRVQTRDMDAVSNPLFRNLRVQRVEILNDLGR